MILGVLRMQFLLHGNRSLKGKRQVAASLRQKLRNKFNVSVSEVAAQDSLDRLILAVATVSGDSRRVQSVLEKALNHAQAATSEELADSDIEIFGSDDLGDNDIQEFQ